MTLWQDQPQLVVEVAPLREIDLPIPVGQPFWSAERGPWYLLQAQHVGIDGNQVLQQLVAQCAAPDVQAHDVHDEMMAEA